MILDSQTREDETSAPGTSNSQTEALSTVPPPPAYDGNNRNPDFPAVVGGATSGASKPSRSSLAVVNTVSGSSQASRLDISDSNSSYNLSQPGYIPSAFSRRPPAHHQYDIFQPIYLIAKGKTLDKGFLLAPPPSAAPVHPFDTHDISENDWIDFLGEIQSSATLTQKDLDRSSIPIVNMIPIVRPLAAYGVQQYMKSRKRHKVVKVIGTWNHHFFELRKVRIILMRGKTALNGPEDGTLSSETVSKGLTSPQWSVDELSKHWNDDNYRLLVVAI